MDPPSATTVCCHSNSLRRKEKITNGLSRAEQREGIRLETCVQISPDRVQCGLWVTCFLCRIECVSACWMLHQFGHKSTGTLPIWLNYLTLLLVHFIKTDELTEQKSKQKVTQWATKPVGVRWRDWSGVWFLERRVDVFKNGASHYLLLYTVPSLPQSKSKYEFELTVFIGLTRIICLKFVLSCVVFCESSLRGRQANLQSSSFISELVRV